MAIHSAYDSIDRNHVHLGYITKTTKEKFTSEILITLTGNLTGELAKLDVEEVRVVNPIQSINFGSIGLDDDND